VIYFIIVSKALQLTGLRCKFGSIGGTTENIQCPDSTYYCIVTFKQDLCIILMCKMNAFLRFRMDLILELWAVSSLVTVQF